jgi:hypothetical protein
MIDEGVEGVRIDKGDANRNDEMLSVSSSKVGIETVWGIYFSVFDHRRGCRLSMEQ